MSANPLPEPDWEDGINPELLRMLSEVLGARVVSVVRAERPPHD